jgi:hypothetical protein
MGTITIVTFVKVIHFFFLEHLDDFHLIIFEINNFDKLIVVLILIIFPDFDERIFDKVSNPKGFFILTKCEF